MNKRSIARIVRIMSGLGFSAAGAIAPAAAAIITNTDLGLGGFSLQTLTSQTEWSIDGDGVDVFIDPIGTFHSPVVILDGNFSIFRYSDQEPDRFGTIAGFLIIEGTKIDGSSVYQSHISLFDVGFQFNIVSEGYFFGKATTTLSFDHVESGEPFYFGFRFRPAEEFLYGWAAATLTFTVNTVDFDSYGFSFLENPATLSIDRWAYDDSGAPILAGQTSAIPEPATYSVIAAVFIFGVTLSKRSRNKGGY